MKNHRFGTCFLAFTLSLAAAACGSSGSDEDVSVARTEPSAGSSDVTSAPATTFASSDEGPSSDDAMSESDDGASESFDAVSGEVLSGAATDGGATKFSTDEVDVVEADVVEADVLEGEVIEPTIPLPPQPQPGSNLLTAADVDDNLNFSFFGQYLIRIADQYGQSSLPSPDLSSRTIVSVLDEQGRPVVNALVRSGESTAYSNPDGVAYLYGSSDATATVTSADGSITTEVAIDDGRAEVNLDYQSVAASGLDLAIVLDTTGSMGDELAFLTKEFESIVRRTADAHPEASLRFALIVYRDVGDQYVTRTFDFTDDPTEIAGQLAEQFADGGGDYPEAVDAALADAVKLNWRSDVSRALILNADAPPHTERAAAALASANELGELGVRIYPLAASGVADEAEYLFRIMAARTGGRYLFLTNDSGIGNEKAEPKVQCYVVTSLNDLLVRVLDSELSLGRAEPTDDQVIRTVGSYTSGVCAEPGQD